MLQGTDAEKRASISAQAVVAFHDDCLGRENAGHDSWPPAEPYVAAEPLWQWIGENHRNNCLLWAEEDLARRTTVPPAEIAKNKRAIDGFNQARNDATERVDEILLLQLGLVTQDSARTSAPQSAAPGGARLNSETAGSMLDRMSIMALKVKAMRWQLARSDVDQAFLSATRQKLDRLLEQRQDLAGCFDQLLADSRSGVAYFKVYRQFKMYNDASMNPALLNEAKVSKEAQARQTAAGPKA